MIVFIALLFIGAIGFSYYYKNQRKNDKAFKRLFKTVSNNLAMFGILFGFLTLIRYENIPYFSMRIWLYGAIAWFIYYEYRLFVRYTKEYPTLKEKLAKKNVQKEEKQYLPNKKK